MKTPGIPVKKLRYLIGARCALWRAFTVGSLLGVGFLMLGTVAASLYDPQRFGDQVPPRITAIAQTLLASACAAGALSCMVDGYIQARGFAKSVRSIVNEVLASGVGVVTLTIAAIMIGATAMRYWIHG